MKLVLFFVFAASSVALVGLHSAEKSAARGKAQAAAAPAAIVIELFTSEGCSSCPPADSFLARLEAEQPVPGTQIIAIEEHVDYWNHDGWIDPFSSQEWTLRQQDYAAAFRRDGAYTPQMVVNGKNQFVGSRSDLAAKAFEEARAVPSIAVTIQKLPVDNPSEPHFAVSVAKLGSPSAKDSAEVWLAITESGLASQVSAGENAGHHLAHASVLRSLRRIGVADAQAAASSFQGDTSAKLKSGWKRENLSAVVFVQEKKSKHILGAAAIKIAG